MSWHRSSERGSGSEAHGVILGKFLPPHAGHCYLIDFARHYATHLTVIVGSLAREPIPGEVRVEWLRQLYPTVRILHLTDENPQYPAEHPDFWSLWEQSLRRLIPRGGVDLLFASEPYGAPLARRLGAEYVPVDPARERVPVSGAAIRQRPLDHWRYLPGPVRPWYLKRLCIVGPESTGKSTLARRLANHYHTCCTHEYARTLIEILGNRFGSGDYARFVRGQIAAEAALAPQANRLLVCDTDPLTTTLWAEVFHGGASAEIVAQAEAHRYDHYLLLAPDTPWVEDAQRFQPDPDDRQRFFHRMRERLIQLERPFTEISGGWSERFAQAVGVVEAQFDITP